MSEYYIKAPCNLMNRQSLKIVLQTKRLLGADAWEGMGYVVGAIDEHGNPESRTVTLDDDKVEQMKELGWMFGEIPPCDCGYCSLCKDRILGEMYENLGNSDRYIIAAIDRLRKRLDEHYESLSDAGKIYCNSKAPIPYPCAGAVE
jgi:hypothetical protein